MDRKAFIARLIAVPAALLSINALTDVRSKVADPAYPLDLPDMNQNLLWKYPMTYTDTAEYAELRRAMATDLITYGELSYHTKAQADEGFSSITFKGKIYHFYKSRLVAVQ